ncbi:acylphosphatase [Limibacter armeniacum]|uniref:acylphosphatase n=1 Tax=Limibacter armeniacum TaxID=466084 RepID=UPI002FE5A69C
MSQEQNQGWEVILQGSFCKSGILFLCMKEAEELNLTGQGYLLSDTMAQVKLYGNKKQLEEFLNWVKSGKLPKRLLNIQISYVGEITYEEYNYFEIL